MDCSGSVAADKPAVKILISRAVNLTLQPRLKKLKKLGILLWLNQLIKLNQLIQLNQLILYQVARKFDSISVESALKYLCLIWSFIENTLFTLLKFGYVHFAE